MFKEFRIPINNFYEIAKSNIDTYSKYVLMLPLPYITKEGVGKFEQNDYGHFIIDTYSCLYHGYETKCNSMKTWFFTDKRESIADIFDIDDIYVLSDPKEEAELVFDNHPFARAVGCMCYDYDAKGNIRLNLHNIISCLNMAFNDYYSTGKVMLVLPGTTTYENYIAVATLRNVFMHSPCEVVVVYYP